jgi:manganese/zinc/iron transport system permease protein
MIFDIILIGCVVAAACSIPGVFLVLRRMSLQSDAISHSVLFGIVISFLIVKDFDSPLLMVGAAATGVLTVVLSELLLKTKLIKEDASIGLVFPALFSIGVILISKFAGDIHLDTDVVLTGEIALAPFDRFELGTLDLGPRSVWNMGGIGLLNLAFLLCFFKELKLSTFDAGLAASLGFRPALLHYILMIMVSITAVGAFETVGSILVVALMIAPAATAHMLTDRLSLMVVLTLVAGVVSAIIGVLAAFAFDTAIAGTMAVVCGIVFAAALFFSPRYGLVAKSIVRRERKRVFACYTLGVHLLNHEGMPEQERESDVRNIQEHLRWNQKFIRQAVSTGIRNGYLRKVDMQLHLTPLGRETVRSLMDRG